MEFVNGIPDKRFIMASSYPSLATADFFLPPTSTLQPTQLHTIEDNHKALQQEMLHCLPPEPPTLSSSAVHDPQIYLHPPPIQAGSSMDGIPGSSAQPSPTLNLSREYITVVHTDSYKEMWSITRPMGLVVDREPGDQDDSNHQLMLAQVLRPNGERVLDALSCVKSNTLTSLVSSYFRYSEETTSLCLNLQKSVDEARKLYWPLQTLISDLHIDSLSQSHCDLVFDELLKFDEEENPFPRPDSHTFNTIRDVFLDLKRQLERRLRKSSSRIRLVRHATADSAICCVGTVCTAYIPPKFAKGELAHVPQLKVASKNTYVLKTDLDTLDSLVGRLHNAVEDDKRFIRLGLNIGNDKHTIQEVLKQLEKNHQNLVHYLVLLEEKTCTCLTTVNRSRSQLLQEILRHRNSSKS